MSDTAPGGEHPAKRPANRLYGVVFGAAVVAEVVWLALAEVEALPLATHFGELQHLAAMAGGTPMLLVAWWAAIRWRIPARWEIVILLLAALAIRGVLWFEPLEGTRDALRYMWDGKVQDEGFDPYRYPPNHEELRGLREGTYYPRIYRKDLPTCYPPVAEGWFWAGYKMGGGGFQGWKAVLLLHELLAVAVIWLALRRRRKPGGHAVVYGLAPLAAVQTMVGMHLDALYVPWLAAAFLFAKTRPGLAGASAMVATMVRPLAIAAVPALMWGRQWREAAWIAAGATIAGLALVLPYASAGSDIIGSIPDYMMEWEFNGAIYGLFKTWTGDPITARKIGYGITIALALVFLTRSRWSAEGRFAASIGAYYAFAPTIYPWYMAMLIVPWLFVGGFTPLVLGAIVAISETVEIPHRAGLAWRVPTRFLILEWSALAVFLLFDLGLLVWWRRRRREGVDHAG